VIALISHKSVISLGRERKAGVYHGLSFSFTPHCHSFVQQIFIDHLLYSLTASNALIYSPTNMYGPPVRANPNADAVGDRAMDKAQFLPRRRS
jgi:hypothetical protein